MYAKVCKHWTYKQTGLKQLIEKFVKSVTIKDHVHKLTQTP